MNDKEKRSVEAGEHVPADGERLVWQRPQVHKLKLNIDTALTSGSGGDGLMATSIASEESDTLTA